MMKWVCATALIFSGYQAMADILVTTRTIRPGTVIVASDLGVLPGDRADSFSYAADVIGQEARVALYPNRPIHFDHVGPPALVERNQIVSLRYVGAKLAISTEGRSLDRGGVGDRVRIMNLSSRATIFGYVQPDGTIKVSR